MATACSFKQTIAAESGLLDQCNAGRLLSYHLFIHRAFVFVGNALLLGVINTADRLPHLHIAGAAACQRGSPCIRYPGPTHSGEARLIPGSTGGQKRQLARASTYHLQFTSSGHCPQVPRLLQQRRPMRFRVSIAKLSNFRWISSRTSNMLGIHTRGACTPKSRWVATKKHCPHVSCSLEWWKQAIKTMISN